MLKATERLIQKYNIGYWIPFKIKHSDNWSSEVYCIGKKNIYRIDNQYKTKIVDDVDILALMISQTIAVQQVKLDKFEYGDKYYIPQIIDNKIFAMSKTWKDNFCDYAFAKCGIAYHFSQECRDMADLEGLKKEVVK